ncbi:eryA, partial [Symbiodinium microadriaticum]
EQQWDAKALVTYRGLPWDYGGTKKRKRPLYTSARVPLLPDNATLEELAKAAGTAAAEAIAASTPKPNNNNDEAGSDSPTSSSTSSPSPVAPEEGESTTAMAVDGEELSNFESWMEEVGESFAEGGLLDDSESPSWDEHGEHAPELSEAWTPWTQDLFAPASNLGAVHSFMTLALTFGLELVTIDVKDAYLNVPQPEPVVIEVEAALLDSSATGVVTYVLERLLPGQRVGASAWYGFAKQILNDNGLVNFAKEPTVFRHEDPQNPTALLLHADDGLLAATKKGREKLVGEMRKVVNVQVSEP